MCVCIIYLGVLFKVWLDTNSLFESELMSFSGLLCSELDGTVLVQHVAEVSLTPL